MKIKITKVPTVAGKAYKYVLMLHTVAVRKHKYFKKRASEEEEENTEILGIYFVSCFYILGE
jgi:hypothetical protein